MATTTEPRFRTIGNLSPAAVRVALPDGWDARILPAECNGDSVRPAEWEGRHVRGSRVTARSAEALLAKLWAVEARRVSSGQEFFTDEE
jgi:hypothetical protein